MDVKRTIEELWDLLDLKGAAAFPAPPGNSSLFQRMYSARWLPLRLRLLIWSLAQSAHWDQRWLQDLDAYWTGVLHGRPIGGPLGFSYLYGTLRERFYRYSTNLAADWESHLSPWQAAPLIYQLVDLAYLESTKSDVDMALLVKRHSPKDGVVLEFGAGIAPVTRCVHQFGMAAKRTFYVADIPTHAFHYAVWRFSRHHEVRPIVLREEEGFILPKGLSVDLIVCREVFEHLPDPVQTVQSFAGHLKSGGVLIFDYVKSDARGLDTKLGLTSRLEAIALVRERFDLLEGDLSDPDRSLPTTVVRLRA